MNGNNPDYTVTELTGIEGPVQATTKIFAKTTMNYELETPVVGNYTFNVEIKGARNNEVLTLVVDNGFEIIGTDNDMVYMKVIDQTPLILTVSKAIAPVAEILLVNEANYMFDDNGVYIVNANENITVRSTSSDQVGTIENITWLPGDGISPMYTNEITFKYKNDGLHTLRLKIKDSSGLEANITEKFFVDTTAPVISFSIENATGVDITTLAKAGTAQEDEETQILFNATMTTDNKFGIEELTFVWNFGDGTGVVNGNKTTHTFTKPGKYNITLEARDPLGHNTTIEINGFTVRDTSNPWPVIDTNDNVDMGEIVTFNATQSYDEDFSGQEMYDRISKYEWDFDYDDENFTKDMDGKIVTWQFQKPKTYKVMLRVTDVAGNVGETTRFVNVRGPDLAILMEPKISNPSKDFKEGDDLKFTINITNQGSIPYQNITVRVWYGDNKVIGEQVIANLKPNQKVNVTIRWKGDGAVEGEKLKIHIMVDPENAIAETNEENNRWNLTIKVESNIMPIIIVSVIAGIIIVLIAAYFVWRKFFTETDSGDEDRKDKRKKSGEKKKGKKKDEDDDDWDDDDD
jgi:PKD repeat protein